MDRDEAGAEESGAQVTDPSCNGCRAESTDATHTCRAIGWPPVKTYGCHVREITQADDETREAMRQLMWAAYDQMKRFDNGGNLTA